MKFTEQEIQGVFVIEPQKFGLGSVRRGVERFIEMKRQKTALFAKKETSPGISE